MIIAVDAAGGDHYPQSPVAGAVEAVKAQDDLKVMLVGPQAIIEDELSNYQYDSEKVLVHHAPEIISMDEPPAQAVKTKRNSSIVAGNGLLKAGKCNGFISAGNTGALLAASTFILGKLEGVSRPTIAAIYPTVKGPRLLLDAGANLQMRNEMYVEFAQMGSVYVKSIMGVQDPRVGLLNVGEEEEKGTDELKDAFKSLQDLPNFIGNVEGKDILTAKADVFICDGLVGNLLLKLGESIPPVLEKFIGRAAQKMNLSREQVQLVSKVLKTSLSEFNPDTIGGVPFLGVNGVSMVGHGGSSPEAIKNMILNAVKCVENNINDEIVASLK
ncbi:MAG: phosphate acyltransferase PlsX [Balneolaceae bacterium]|nr:phosphate acyltransferase PlsX [Balneolaceae bacterium]